MNTRSLPLALLAFSVSVGLLLAESVPPLINYQGRLTDAAGATLADGQYRVAFRLWDDPAASSTNVPTHLIWGCVYDVTLIQGAFNVILGSGGISVPGAAMNDLGYAFSASNRFLGLTITRNLSGDIVPNQQREILPRQQILSAPFALAAQQAQHAEQAAVAAALVKDLADALCPPGSIMPFGGNQLPDGWLLCDGSPISSGKYPRLFTAISTNWGAGLAGSTNNFNLPDLRGLFLRGLTGTRTNGFGDPDFASRTNAPAGGNNGNAVGSIQGDEFKRHRHGIGGSKAQYLGGGPLIFLLGNLNNEGEIGFEGGAETRPKNAYVNYIIKY